MSIYFNNATSPLGELYEVFRAFDVEAIRRTALLNKHLPIVMPWHYAEAKWLRDNKKCAFGLCFPAAYKRVINFLNALKKYNQSIYAGYLIQASVNYTQILFYFVGNYMCANGTDGLTEYMKKLLDGDIAGNEYDDVESAIKQYARVQALSVMNKEFCFEQMWLYLMRIGGVEWAKKSVRSWPVRDEYKEMLNSTYKLAKTKIKEYDRETAI